MQSSTESSSISLPDNLSERGFLGDFGILKDSSPDSEYSTDLTLDLGFSRELSSDFETLTDPFMDCKISTNFESVSKTSSVSDFLLFLLCLRLGGGSSQNSSSYLSEFDAEAVVFDDRSPVLRLNVGRSTCRYSPKLVDCSSY